MTDFTSSDCYLQAYIRNEFTKDRDFNAKLKRLNIEIPWPVVGTPKKRVATKDPVDEVTTLTQKCLISDPQDKTEL